MNYSQTLAWLFKRLPMYQRVGASAMRLGLDQMNRLSAALGNPHRSLKCIHIAGTNGKGSTAHMLASVLQTAGYTVGLYTSPHLNTQAMHGNADLLSYLVPSIHHTLDTWV